MKGKFQEWGTVAIQRAASVVTSVKARAGQVMIVGALALAVIGGLNPGAAFAGSSAALPDIGIDMVDFIEALGTKMGLAVAAIVGLAFAFLVVWLALRKSRSAAG